MAGNEVGPSITGRIASHLATLVLLIAQSPLLAAQRRLALARGFEYSCLTDDFCIARCGNACTARVVMRHVMLLRSQQTLSSVDVEEGVPS